MSGHGLNERARWALAEVICRGIQSCPMDKQPLNVGDTAPDFELMDQDKNPVRLTNLTKSGKRVVL